MTELARLSQMLIDESPARRASLDDLRSRSHKRHVRHWLQTVGALVVVLAVAFGAVQTEHSASTPPLPSTQLASYYEAAVNVSNSTLAAVGLPPTVAIPSRVTPSRSTVATNGVVSYVGAEYCPYCAFQRWALLVALSKFGTFTHLDNAIFSSSSDVYPHLASWSFVGTTYSSKYFTFDPTELTSSKRSRGGPGGFQRLQRMSAAQRVAFNKYNPQGSIPFIDVGNNYVTLGASSSPSVLEGLSLSEIGSDLNRPSSAVAQAIDGSANYLIAGLCTMTQTAAPALCSTSAIRSASRSLQTGTPSSTESPSATTYPVQPPTNAPLAVWKKWSVAEHRFWLHAAATYRSPNSACTVVKTFVTGRKLSKPLFGIPAGVWLWGMSLTGSCLPGHRGGLVARTH
ncbi:MAG TPA: DUF929 family protein [Acidimicrobiales bacterium]